MRGHWSLRFMDKVDWPLALDGCWLWTAALEQSGYGMFHFEGRTQRAHRVAYEQLRAPIPEGLHIDHLCKVRRCVNPWHMEPVTLAENNRRGHWASKTHCPKGHPYSGDNLYVRKRSGRSCQACHRESERKRRAKKRALQVDEPGTYAIVGPL